MAAMAVFSSGLTVATAIIVYHNLRYSYARVLDILGGAANVAADGSFDLTPVAVPAWVSPFMQDLSVVSPALVLFTSVRMLVAALLLLQAPERIRRWGHLHFPFPDPYKVYFIQMGLLGTIVGFVLAFAEVDPQSERQSIILLEALGTALWSTLTAIVLAYVFCPVVEGLYARTRNLLLGAAPRDTRSALDALRERTSAAASELDALAGATRSLAAESRALGDELRDRRLDSRVAQLENTLSEIARQLEEIREGQHRLRDQQVGFAADSRALTARLDADEKAMERHSDGLAKLDAATASLVTSVADLVDEAKRSRAARERLAGLEAWLRTPPRETDED